MSETVDDLRRVAATNGWLDMTPDETDIGLFVHAEETQTTVMHATSDGDSVRVRAVTSRREDGRLHHTEYRVEPAKAKRLVTGFGGAVNILEGRWPVR